MSCFWGCAFVSVGSAAVIGLIASDPVPGSKQEESCCWSVVPRKSGASPKLCSSTAKLRRHGPFIIAGYGEFGGKVVELFQDTGDEMRVISQQPGSGVQIAGNAPDTKLLVEAGVEKAQAVILALHDDSTTLFATVI